MPSLYRLRSNPLRTTGVVVTSFMFVNNPFAAAYQIAETCTACFLDGTDPDECVIYGKVEDDVVGWGLGNESSDSDWEQPAKDFKSNTIELEDSLVIDGVTMNCEGSEGDSFNFMKPYFEDGNGSVKNDQVCDKLYNKVRVDRSLEQATLRIRHCMELKEEAAIPVSCSSLGTQAGDLVHADPERDFYGFGFETPLASIPGYEIAASVTSGEGTEDDNDESNLLDDLLESLGFGYSSQTVFVANASRGMTLLLWGNLFETYFMLLEQ